MIPKHFFTLATFNFSLFFSSFFSFLVFLHQCRMISTHQMWAFICHIWCSNSFSDLLKMMKTPQQSVTVDQEHFSVHSRSLIYVVSDQPINSVVKTVNQMSRRMKGQSTLKWIVDMTKIDNATRNDEWLKNHNDYGHERTSTDNGDWNVSRYGNGRRSSMTP